MAIGEDPELKHLQRQNNYFKDSWVELGVLVPAEHQTNFEPCSDFKGAENCNEECNNLGEVFDSTINADYQIQTELEARDLELDPNKTPPEAEPDAQPPPEIDKVCRDHGQSSRVPATPNGTAKGCARYLILLISRSPDTGVVPSRLTATVGQKPYHRVSRGRRNVHICGRQDTRSYRRPITCGRSNMRARDRRHAGRRPS